MITKIVYFFNLQKFFKIYISIYKLMKFFIYIFFILFVSSCGVSKETIKNYENNTQIDSSLVVNVKTDSDNDGITDEDDKCPFDFGYPEGNGCPVLKSDSVIILESNIIKNQDKPDFNKSKEDKVVNRKNDKIQNLIIEDKTIQNKTELVENNSAGIMAYSVPEEMKVGNTYNIKLRITRENNKIQLVQGDRNIPINDISVKSVVTIESVRVEPIMSAQLISEESKFEISSSSTEVQNIEERGYTEWQWLIKPLKGGENFLKLIVKVRVKEDGQEFYKDITVFDKKISVKSNVVFSVKGFINQYWQWLMTTIIIPFIIWFYNRKKDKKKSRK